MPQLGPILLVFLALSAFARAEDESEWFNGPMDAVFLERSDECASFIGNVKLVIGRNLLRKGFSNGVKPKKDDPEFLRFLENHGQRSWLNYVALKDEFVFRIVDEMKLVRDRGFTAALNIDAKTLSGETLWEHAEHLASSTTRIWLNRDFVNVTGAKSAATYFDECADPRKFLASLFKRPDRTLTQKLLTELHELTRLRSFMSAYRFEFMTVLQGYLKNERDIMEATRDEILDAKWAANMLILSTQSNFREVGSLNTQAGLMPLQPPRLAAAQKRFRHFWDLRDTLPTYYRRDILQDLGYINFLNHWDVEPEDFLGRFYESLETTEALH